MTDTLKDELGGTVRLDQVNGRPSIIDSLGTDS